MKRKIVEIDEDKCNGCGLCVPNCYEGALQIIDGKARLISDLFCDGLGNCIGHCPQNAIKIIEREAEPYDEKKVMEKIAKAGAATIKAHLEHLKDHGETEYLRQAIEYLKENNIEVPEGVEEERPHHEGSAFCGCPGSRVMDFGRAEDEAQHGDISSQLRQWPVQLHLVPPNAPFYKNADVLLAADCTAFSLGDFHSKHLKGKALAIACPKLDSSQEIYEEKITAMIDEAKINTLTVMTMEVPCCGALLLLAKRAAEAAGRKIPIKHIVVSVKGEILEENWV